MNESAITCHGDTDEAMGQELEYARSHGIQFWSFCNYPIGCTTMNPPTCPKIQCCADNVKLSYAWNRYLHHADNHFTLLLQPGSWCAPPAHLLPAAARVRAEHLRTCAPRLRHACASFALTPVLRMLWDIA